MKKTQANNIYNLLKVRDWVCVEEMTKLFIVDYRRRLVDLQRRGIELESRKCEQHSYHKGGSKEWKLKNKPPLRVVTFKETPTGRVAVIDLVPTV